MIVRARPDIDEPLLMSLLKGTEFSVEENVDLLFFNNGSAALCFFLKLIGGYKRVGIQAFTCPVLLGVLKEVNCIPVFMDVNKDYFTTTYEIVKSVIDEIDVLLLSHLFGIPNPDYLRIKALCKQKKVVLIDDLCQTFRAKIGNFLVEELSDNYFYSFFLDKPVSGMLGGALHVNSDLIKVANQEYIKLLCETQQESLHLLKKLYFMYKLLDPKIYKKDFRYNTIWEHIIFKYFPIDGNVKLLYGLLTLPINRIFAKLRLRKHATFKIKRMSAIRIFYISSRMKKYVNNNSNLESFFEYTKLQLPRYFNDINITCSIAKRAIVLGTSGVDFHDDIEIGLYNWSTLLSKSGKYPVANSIIKSYVNIPVWKDDIYEKKRDCNGKN